MSSWTPRRVLDAMVAMEWSPDGAIEVRTDDYRLIRYPDWALDPTFPAAQVTRSRTGRAVPEIIDEVAARVRHWHLPGVAWWVSSGTAPPDTEAVLRARGGTRIDAVRILARELDGNVADLAVPADVSVELVADERAFRAASMITVRGWGRKEPARTALAREFAEAMRDLETWSSFRILASAACTRRTRRGSPSVGSGYPPGVPAARCLPGGTGRTVAAGSLPRSDSRPGEGACRDVGADPAPGRFRRVRRGALLLAAAQPGS